MKITIERQRDNNSPSTQQVADDLGAVLAGVLLRLAEEALSATRADAA